MKNTTLILSTCLPLLFLSACQSQSIGIIGGADGPTSVIVSENIHKTEYTKESVRLVRLDRAIYYETGQKSDVQERCGVMDGSFSMTADCFELPQGDFESNFDEATAYQLGTTTDTIEICIDDSWKVFNKIQTHAEVLQYRYGYIVEGTLPNAAKPSRLLVLADEEDVTFDEAAYVVFGSDTTAMKDIYVLPMAG